MESFLRTCKDTHMISDWIVVDDGSSQQDLDKMKERYPFLEIHKNPGKGQAAALNYLFSLVTTQWFFHMEDDWVFLKSGNYIMKLLQICEGNPKIRNATLRHWNGIRCRNEHYGFYFNIHEYLGQGDARLNNCQWYGYSLGCSIQHKPTVDMLGKYDMNHPPTCRRWDRVVAKRYYMLGYLCANLTEPHISHIGEGNSIYLD